MTPLNIEYPNYASPTRRSTENFEGSDTIFHDVLEQAVYGWARGMGAFQYFSGWKN